MFYSVFEFFFFGFWCFKATDGRFNLQQAIPKDLNVIWLVVLLAISWLVPLFTFYFVNPFGNDNFRVEGEHIF